MSLRSLAKRIKRILPHSVVVVMRRAIHGRQDVSTDDVETMALRASRYGINRERFSEIMASPDGALKLDSMHVYGASKRVRFLEESKAFIVESLFEDAYFLDEIEGDRETNWKVLDVGANVGVFAIAARQHFAKATIHCYEPNPKLKELLEVQAFACRAKVVMAAVGKEAGRFSFDNRHNEILGSVSVAMLDFAEPGEIEVIPIRKAIEDIGGYVDLLKLDCEGSEWLILQDRDALRKVRLLAMEYYRFPLDGSFDPYDMGIDIHELARGRVEEIGYRVIHSRQSSVDAGIVLAENRQFSVH